MGGFYVFLVAALAVATSALAAKSYKDEVKRVDVAAGKTMLKHDPLVENLFFA